MLFVYLSLALSLDIKFNGVLYSGGTYENTFSQAGLADTEVRSVEFVSGDFPLDRYSFNKYTNLERFIIPLECFQGSTRKFAFKNLQFLTYVDIPGATYIEEECFNRCPRLEYFNFESVVTIDTKAFEDCSSLTVLNSSSIKTIYYLAFKRANLISIYLPSLEKIYGNFGDNQVFAYNENLISVYIPKVSLLRGSAFKNCTRLETIDALSVTNIYSYCFQNCHSLKEANFPLLKECGSYSFERCYSLTEINFPKITILNSYVFNACKNLKKVICPEVTEVSLQALSFCEKLKEINLPKAYIVGPYSFACSGFTSIDLPRVYTISQSLQDKSGLFYNCVNLHTIKLPLLNRIRKEMFHGCYNLKYLDLSSLDTLNPDYFYVEGGLEYFAVGQTSVDISIIKSRSTLKTLVLPNCVSFTFPSALSGYTALTTLHAPKLESLTGQVFKGCTSLKTINLKSLKTIYNDGAFEGCSILEEVFLDSLVSIKDTYENTFLDCPMLKSISLPNTPPSFHPNTFVNAHVSGGPGSIEGRVLNIEAYDDSTTIAGDVAKDGLWCKIKLVKKPGITVEANLIAGFELNLSDAVKSAVPLASDVLQLDILSGDISSSDMSMICSTYPNLKSLVIEEACTIENGIIPANFMQNHEKINRIIINATVTQVLENAFNECTELLLITLGKTSKLTKTSFVNNRNLMYIYLPFVKQIEGNYIFTYCPSLEKIDLSSLENVVSDNVLGHELISLKRVLLPMQPPVVTDKFSLGYGIADLPEGANYPEYDKADGKRDGKFYGIKLDYQTVFAKIDHIKQGSYSLNSMVSYNTKIIEVVSGTLEEEDLMLSSHPNLKKVVISSDIQISSIPASAFQGLTQLIEVVINSPSEFTISQNAFRNCTELRTITLTNAIIIQDSAFYGCSKLASVALDKVTTIQGDHTFAYCKGMFSLSLQSLTTVPTASEHIFLECILNELKLGSTVPEKFHKNTFSGQSTLLTLPNQQDYTTYDNSVSIEGDAAGDNKWCGISFGVDPYEVLINNYYDIKGIAFDGLVERCGLPKDSITSIRFIQGAYTSSILSSVLELYPELREFVISPECSMENEITSGLFSGTHVEIVSIPMLTVIGENLFANCNNLVEVVFPEVTTIRDSCFLNCINLKSISLPKLEAIEGDSNFKGCNSLNNVNFPSLKTVNSESANIFKGCISFKLTLGDTPPQTFNRNTFNGVKVILTMEYDIIKIYDNDVSIQGDSRDDYFWCSIDLVNTYIKVSMNYEYEKFGKSLKDIEDSLSLTPDKIYQLLIHKGMLTIADAKRIKEYTSLVTLYIYKDVVLESNTITHDIIPDRINEVVIEPEINIANGAFKGCHSLGSVHFSDVNILSDEAFMDCPWLNEVKFDKLSSVEKNGENIFDSCLDLKRIYLPSIPPKTFNKNVFKSVSEVTLFLPQSVDYVNYDDNTDIEGDEKRDGKWCGINLPIENNVLKYVIDEYDYESRDLYLNFVGKEHNGYDSIELKSGKFDSNDLYKTFKYIECFKTLTKFVARHGTLTKIESFTFNSLRKLKELVIQDNIDYSSLSFFGVDSLETLKISGQLTISDTIFEYTKSLKTLLLPNVREFSWSLNGLNSLETVDIRSVVILEGSTFCNCRSLKTININGVKMFTGDNHFTNCSSLCSIVMPFLLSVPESSVDIFKGCDKLQEIFLGPSPPYLFNENVFNGLSVKLSIRDKEKDIRNYYKQSVKRNGKYYWKGIYIGKYNGNDSSNDESSTGEEKVPITKYAIAGGCLLGVIVITSTVTVLITKHCCNKKPRKVENEYP